ncbi:sorting nexin-29 [Athalia rosae]|uniref:sorting nexin-29 n=1 Tax=Athalia rosae TaxID=37344 RepID=UPI0020343D7F|nr:sorting nexin-29 [Athalia rosae]
MNSLLRSVTSVGNKRDVLIKDSLQKQLNTSIIDMQNFTESAESCPVGNCEEANNLCSVLEALFLHGLKDSLLNRVTEALSSPDFQSMPQPSFWGPLLVFSHRQIIDQIQSLTQITTEVGYCRAWVRLALNDGLLSSYLCSICRDNSALKPYYNRAAFVRDTDLVDAAQRLIESIDYIHFDLAYNTSLLNIWSTTPLLMAAVWSPSLKSFPVSSAVDVAKTINSELTSNDDFDEVEVASSIGSLGSLNSSQSALNNLSSINEDDALKIILSKVKTVKSNASQPNGESVNSQSQSQKIKEEVDQSKVVNAEIANGTTIDNEPETEIDTTSSGEEQPVQNSDPLDTDAVATTTVGNSLIGKLGWSSSFEDCESTLNSSAPSQASGAEAPRTPTDSRTYDALIQSYHTAGYATTPDLREFLNGSAPRESAQDSSAADQKLLQGVEEAAARALEHQLGKLPREKGLDTQNYSCLGCGHAIGMTFSKAIVCNYTGEYYCANCMAEGELLIPSRVIHNWDLKRYPVSQKAARFLTNCPVLLDLKILNPRIYMAVDDMAQLQSLRIQLNLLRAYLFTCREPIIESLQQKVTPREYLYEHVHQYSVSDLPDIPNGIMAQQLQKIVEFARHHVMNCWLCSQKGFICEVCDNPKVIYPFDMATTYRCAACNAVFHIDCLNASYPCPKCERRRKRMDLPLLDLGNAELPPVTETPASVPQS